MTELEVPAAAERAFAKMRSTDPEHDYAVRAIATPVVVAELRRIAGTIQHVSASPFIVMGLRQRADELEAGQS